MCVNREELKQLAKKESENRLRETREQRWGVTKTWKGEREGGRRSWERKVMRWGGSGAARQQGNIPACRGVTRDSHNHLTQGVCLALQHARLHTDTHASQKITLFVSVASSRTHMNYRLHTVICIIPQFANGDCKCFLSLSAANVHLVPEVIRSHCERKCLGLEIYQYHIISVLYVLASK